MSSSSSMDAGPGSSFRHRRTLIHVLAAMVLLDLLILSQRDTWHRYAPDDYTERVRTCAEEPRDVIVVGGSPVSEGIDPATLVGMNWRGQPIRSVYALGLPGGTTSECRHALARGSLAPPRMVIYGTTASDLNDARQEPHGPHSLMTWGDWWEWTRTRPQSREWVTRHFFQSRMSESWQLFRYRHGIRMWTAHSVESLLPGTCPDAAQEARENLEYVASIRTGNGYAPNRRFVHRTLSELKSIGSLELESFHFLEKFRMGEHLGYLHRMIDQAQADGTDVILVDMPVAPKLEHEMYPHAFIQFRQVLADLEATRSVRVLRATREAVGLDEDDFSDLIHLNGSGARKLSRWIRDELQRMPEVGAGDGLLQ